MPDSDALRQRRRRGHAAGDHSLCKRCAAVRGDVPLVLSIAPEPAEVDARAELNALAVRLADEHQTHPENAIMARELRLTLESLAKMTPAVSDPMDELRAIVSGVS